MPEVEHSSFVKVHNLLQNSKKTKKTVFGKKLFFQRKRILLVLITKFKKCPFLRSFPKGEKTRFFPSRVLLKTPKWVLTSEHEKKKRKHKKRHQQEILFKIVFSTRILEGTENYLFYKNYIFSHFNCNISHKVGEQTFELMIGNTRVFFTDFQ